MVRASTLALGLLSIAALGSAPPILADQDRQTFSAKTTLLTVDVTALDRNGKPVPGLRAEDFEVKVNGKAQPVQTVAFLEASGAVSPSVAESITGVSGRRSVANLTPGAEARTFMIFVDDIAFEVFDGRALFLSAMDFVARLPAADYVGYAASSGVGLINPTRDRAQVLAALKSAVGRYVNPARAHSDPPIMGIGEALQIVDNGNTALTTEIMLRECFDPKTASTMTGQSIETLQRVSPCAAVVPFRATHIAQEVKALRARQIQAVESTIDALRTLQGIKQFVLLTNGLAVGRDILDLVPVARAAARAGVEVSTMVQEGDIDLSDVGSSPDIPGGSAPVSPGQAQKRREDNQILLGGAQTMTDMAGGQFYRVIGQPRRFFDFVQASAGAVYRLGVALPPEIPPGREIEITASVKRQGVSALTSHHAAAPAIETALPADEQMKNAVRNGESLYGVPIAFGAIVRRSGAPGQLEVGAVAKIPATVDGPLNAVFGVLDESGALKTGNRSVSSTAGDYLITLAIPVTPGTYSLRLAAADAKGHVGAVTMPLNATLTTVGPVEASDLLTWVPDAGGRMRLVVFEDLPPGTDALTAMVELYPRGAAPPDLSVRFEILNAAGKMIADSPATMTAGAGLTRADAKFDVTSLAPGLYGLRGAVSISATIAGTVSTTFRKQ